MENIKTVEDAFNITKMPTTPAFSEIPEELRNYFKAVYEAIVVTKALVGNWKPDWNDDNQAKYYHWFLTSSDGFIFCVTRYVCLATSMGNTSRLCFPTEEMAEYAGKQFIDVYSRIILN